MNVVQDLLVNAGGLQQSSLKDSILYAANRRSLLVNVSTFEEQRVLVKRKVQRPSQDLKVCAEPQREAR
jgi:hypothetical protein